MQLYKFGNVEFYYPLYISDTKQKNFGLGLGAKLHTRQKGKVAELAKLGERYTLACNFDIFDATKSYNPQYIQRHKVKQFCA